MPEPTLRVRLHAILFVASEPLTAARLATVTGSPTAEVEKELAQLKASTASDGVTLSVTGGEYRLVSAPQAADTVRRFLGEQAGSDLSRAALETLAIVAYRGPLTKSAIEEIRGVASDTMLRNLLTRGLVKESGKSPEQGHPLLYAVSHRFLQHFGLTSTEDLPVVTEAPDED